jgi:hypothetical protein
MRNDLLDDGTMRAADARIGATALLSEIIEDGRGWSAGGGWRPGKSGASPGGVAVRC